MNHDRLTRRLTDHLHDAASAAPLRPGSELAIVRAARRRAARRRHVTAAASVVAVGGVTTIGLHQLSGGSGGAEIRIGSEIPGVDAPGVVDEAPAATPPPDAVPAAEFVESSLVWRTVRPDAAEAVGMTGWGREVAFPGVLLSTAPGRSDEHVPQLWRSDDGITFTETGTPPSDAPLPLSLHGRGERLYAFGTASGVAADTVNPLVATVSSDGGNSWVDVPLPVDGHLGASTPGITGRTISVREASIADDGSVLLLVDQNFYVDPATYGITEYFDVTHDGIVVPTDDCATTGTTMPGAPVVEATTTSIESLTGGAPDESLYGCATTVRTWDELGVPAETVQLLREPRHRLLHSVDGESFVEIELPVADAFQVHVPSNRLHMLAIQDVDGATALHRLAADLTWQPIAIPDVRPGLVTELDGRLVVASDNSVTDSAPLVSMLGDDGTWRSIRLADAAAFRYLADLAAGPSGLLASSYSFEDGGDVTIASAPDATTTTTISPDPPVTAPATTVEEYGPQGPPTWEVFHSADGVRWSKESVADLAGVPATQISSIARVATAGDTFVVTVTLVAPDAETIPEQIVLVGTPAG